MPTLEKSVLKLVILYQFERWSKTGLETFLIVEVCPRKWKIKEIRNDQTWFILDKYKGMCSEQII